jgi:hypothetical protein
MDCQEFLQKLDKFIEAGEEILPPLSGVAHLDECADCRGIYDQHVALGRQLRALPKACAPKGLMEQVMAGIPARTRRRVFGVGVPRMRTMVAIAVALALFILPLNNLVNHDRPFVALTDSTATIEVDGRNIVVPSGVNVRGDMKVINGHLTVLGSVEGNITLIKSVLVSGPEARIGRVYTVDWTFLQQISYGIAQFAEDVKSYARGMWR